LTAIFLIEPPTRAFERARQAALRAVELDAKLPDGYIALGHVITEHDRDLPVARRHFARALELKPDSAPVQAQLSMNLTQAGDLAGARDAIRKAQLLEPASYGYLSLSGFIHYFQRAFDDSERELSRLVESVPQGALARQFLANTLLIRGKGAEVLRLLEGRNELAPTAYGNRARAHVQTGDVAAARQEIARLERLATQGFGVEYALATIHVELGEDDRALGALERATNDAQMLGYMNVDPALDPIRKSPRFAAVAQRMRLA
jgi:tetratricopeptide (TPR) repeat protein